jgi:hypothetical protein
VKGERVVVIIVNYRTSELTMAAVESVLLSRGVDIHVVLVDNASGDDSADCFRSRFQNNPAVTLLVRDRNDGFSGGNNAGFDVARSSGARFAFLLNSDTLIDDDCVRLLVEEADRDSATALACPRIVYGHRPDLLWFGGATFSLWRGRPVHVGLGKPVSRGWTQPRELPFASGCALLMRISAVQGPLFDKSLFSYAEDLDLSLRLRSLGHQIRFVPAGRVLHFEGASHRRAGGQALRVYLNTRNLIRVTSRHARWYQWITLAPALMVDLIARYSAIAVRDRDASGFVAVWRGARDAVTGGRHRIECE